MRRTRRWLVAGVAAALTAGAVVLIFPARSPDGERRTRAFAQQLCALPVAWRQRVRRGHHPARSGQISLLPKTPTYMATGAGGWSHSGPWDYLQSVPLVFYGPGILAGGRRAAGAVTLADVAPTIARLIGSDFRADAGRALDDVVKAHTGRAPRVVVTIVWDGGGWNTLRQWPRDWPNLRRVLRSGISYPEAMVGSSPSVTPAVHTTLGTGEFPVAHGITGVPVRDEQGEVVDSFLKGESGRFIQEETLAQAWDRSLGQRPLVGMVGYEPWHLGMIGEGAERPGADRDHAAWLDVDTNEWITNPNHYVLPAALVQTPGLADDLEALDAADGVRDRAWRGHRILDEPDRVEETPAFITYHTRALMNLVAMHGYGDDSASDLLFTNYKQIDRVGHYFNMRSPEVRDSLVTTDRELGRFIEFLDAEVGEGNWMIVVTADHGQQPDAPEAGGAALDPNEIEADIAAAFGPIVRAVWPTEVFLVDDEMERRGVTVDEVARWLSGYSLEEGAMDLPAALDPDQHAFDLAIPADRLPRITCRDGSRSGSGTGAADRMP